MLEFDTTVYNSTNFSQSVISQLEETTPTVVPILVITVLAIFVVIWSMVTIKNKVEKELKEEDKVLFGRDKQ